MMGRRDVSSTNASHHCVMTRLLLAMDTMAFVVIVATAIGLWNPDGWGAIPDASAAESARAQDANEPPEIAARAAQQQTDAAVQSEPFSLAFVPRDTKVVAGMRTSALRNS